MPPSSSNKNKRYSQEPLEVEKYLSSPVNYRQARITKINSIKKAELEEEVYFSCEEI